MSLVLQPQANFTVVRQIANHLDSATYYVRAVVRNAYTDAIIETLDLEDKGGQRFKKNWRVPADPSGQGHYISIVTSVYTDSDYTTKSENYGDEETTYLVQERVLVGRGGGGGIDSRTVRRIMREELEKAKPEEKEEEPEEEPEPIEIPRYDSELGEILREIRKRPTTIPPVDMKPVIDAIKNKKVTPATDLKPLIEGLTALRKALEEARDDASLDHKEVGELFQSVLSQVAEIPGKVEEIVSNTEFSVAPSTATGTVKKQEKEEPVKSPLDINRLAL